MHQLDLKRELDLTAVTDPEALNLEEKKELEGKIINDGDMFTIPLISYEILVSNMRGRR